MLPSPLALLQIAALLLLPSLLALLQTIALLLPPPLLALPLPIVAPLLLHSINNTLLPYMGIA